mmetsp:Transcript_68355/g.182370  ORF Transcript_68355/g.182370 Transcript_68355/m.182370 type:complete len:188 (+) Transcript_68355:212-775(+)
MVSTINFKPMLKERAPRLKAAKVVLDSKKAAEIFMHKAACDEEEPEFRNQNSNSRLRSPSAKLALRYGVSAKTIRDIWNRKTWIGATEGIANFPETLHDCQKFKQAGNQSRPLEGSCIGILDCIAQAQKNIFQPAMQVEYPIDAGAPSCVSSGIEGSSEKNALDRSMSAELKFLVENDPFHFDWPYW